MQSKKSKTVTQNAKTSKSKSKKKSDAPIKDLTAKNKRETVEVKGTIINYPFLLEIKPKERYIFRSNDYKCDGQYCTILSYFHKQGAVDNYPAFWGINLIPSGLKHDVSIICVQTIERKSDGWVKDRQQNAENVAQMNANEQDSSTNRTNRLKSMKRDTDLTTVAAELQSGATYLECAFKLLIRANTYEELVDTIHEIERLYTDRFSTLYATSFDGNQRQDLASLLMPLSYKLGKPFGLTSTELAGQYSLITRGIEDNNGDYVGEMTGDVNTAAVLFDIDDYVHHILVCSEQIDNTYYRAHVPDMWGSKISQCCLMNNHKVAHIILDDCDLYSLGPEFGTISREINMNTGDINMFELFGDFDDEISLFSKQMQKLKLMAEQAYKSNDHERSIFENSFEEVATKFYIENRMWHNDAANNRDKLRVVGVPHTSIPKLDMFCAYLDTEYKALSTSSNHDSEKLHAISVLNGTFKNLLSTNGDLFNTITNPVIDEMKLARRTIYDFSELSSRGIGLMMAQLINILAFICSYLGEEDTLIIHGAEFITDDVKEYIDSLFLQLYNKGGRVCFLYNDMDKMLKDQRFNYIDKADYTILGNMTENACAIYQDVIGANIPANMSKLITRRGNDRFTYVHRDYQNVMFNRDLVLFPNSQLYP